MSVCISGGSGPLRGLMAPCGCDLSKEGVPLYSQLASAVCPECAGAIGPTAQPCNLFHLCNTLLATYAQELARQASLRCPQFLSPDTLEQEKDVNECVFFPPSRVFD